MKGVTEKLAFREKITVFIGMYRSHEARKCSVPFLSLVCESRHHRKKVTIIHQNSEHRYLKIVPNNYSVGRVAQSA